MCPSAESLSVHLLHQDNGPNGACNLPSFHTHSTGVVAKSWQAGEAHTLASRSATGARALLEMSRDVMLVDSVTSRSKALRLSSDRTICNAETSGYVFLRARVLSLGIVTDRRPRWMLNRNDQPSTLCSITENTQKMGSSAKLTRQHCFQCWTAGCTTAEPCNPPAPSQPWALRPGHPAEEAREGDAKHGPWCGMGW